MVQRCVVQNRLVTVLRYYVPCTPSWVRICWPRKWQPEEFPGGSLQERVENMADWYKIYGTHFVRAIIENSDDFTKGFTLLYLND